MKKIAILFLMIYLMMLGVYAEPTPGADSVAQPANAPVATSQPASVAPTTAPSHSVVSQAERESSYSTAQKPVQQATQPAPQTAPAATPVAGAVPTPTVTPPVPQESPDRCLRRCYGQEMRCLAQYEARSTDPEYGPVFSRLAAQEREHCRIILELLGRLQK